MKVVHSNVALLMKLRNIKCPEVAEKTGLNEYTVWKSRANRLMGACRLESLYKIASVLGVSVNDLYSIVDTKEALCLKTKYLKL